MQKGRTGLGTKYGKKWGDIINGLARDGTLSLDLTCPRDQLCCAVASPALRGIQSIREDHAHAKVQNPLQQGMKSGAFRKIY
jgi:hypothetical protein